MSPHPSLHHLRLPHPPDRAAPRRAYRAAVIGVTGLTALVLGACSSGATQDPSASGAPSSSAASEASSSAAAPVGARITLATDAGVAVLDAKTLQPVGEVPMEGFLRLNGAGNDEHVFVTTAKGFEVLATGASTGSAPTLTGTVFPAETAGHVVVHEDKTVLFDDATGNFWSFATDALTDSAAMPEGVKTYKSAAAHHGVAVELSDGTVLATIGDEETRVGVRQLDNAGTETARSDKCPSVHGEGVAADERVLFGCEDGVLMWADGKFTKLDSPDEYGRVGNTYVTDETPTAIVDYNDDPDAEGVLLHRVGVIDTKAGKWQVVDLPDGVEYSWQGVERADDGSAWLIGTDGALHQLDGTTGKVAESFPVIDAWEGPAEWQDAHPYLVVHDGTGYVTDPAKKAVHAVDLGTGKVTGTAELTGTPNEMAIAG